MVERFNQLEESGGIVPATCDSQLREQYHNALRRDDQFGQQLWQALEPQHWPLATFRRKVDLPWLLGKGADVVPKILAGAFARLKRPARGQRSPAAGDNNAAANATSDWQQLVPLDWEATYELPPWELTSGECVSWSDEFSGDEHLRLYDQRQVELIQWQTEHLPSYDDRLYVPRVNSVVVSGTPGIGKDFLLRMVASQLELAGCVHGDVLMVDTTQLTRESETQEAIKAGLLILSAPERACSTAWRREYVATVLRQRWDLGKPTWTTTNCGSLAQLADQIEPPAVAGDPNPMVRRLATDPEQHFIRTTWQPWYAVAHAVEDGELVSRDYWDVFCPADELELESEQPDQEPGSVLAAPDPQLDDAAPEPFDIDQIVPPISQYMEAFHRRPPPVVSPFPDDIELDPDDLELVDDLPPPRHKPRRPPKSAKSVKRTKSKPQAEAKDQPGPTRRFDWRTQGGSVPTLEELDARQAAQANGKHTRVCQVRCYCFERSLLTAICHGSCRPRAR